MSIDLSKQLTHIFNKIECPDGITFCTFQVKPVQDDKPENQTSFYVELIRVSSGAEIDPSRKYAKVIVLPSDHPNGLIQLSLESRYVFANWRMSSVTIPVERLGYQGKTLMVSYRTVEFPEKQVLAGVNINAAVAELDFKSKDDILTFTPFETLAHINISLEVTKYSSLEYPKAFKVLLSNVTSEGELGEAVSMVTIVTGSSGMWRNWAGSQQVPLNNASIEV